MQLTSNPQQLVQEKHTYYEPLLPLNKKCSVSQTLPGAQGSLALKIFYSEVFLCPTFYGTSKHRMGGSNPISGWYFIGQTCCTISEPPFWL